MKPTYKVIVAGTRSFSDYPLLHSFCDNLLLQKELLYDIVIVSGTAKGADRLGEQYAIEHGYRLEKFPADWDKYGRAAGMIRNSQMADNAQALIAFWDGKSRGTKNMIDVANRKGLMVYIAKYPSA